MAEFAPQSPVLNEVELVERARSRDPVAIRLIVKQQNQRLYRIARSIVRDDSEAEDVLQEAYVRAFNGLDAFRGEARLGTWLARIVINEALGFARKRRPAVEFDALDKSSTAMAQVIPFPNSTSFADPETAVAQQQIRATLEQAIDGLPDMFREIVVARLIEGMSIEDTAELFGILPQTVKTRLHRARALLRREIEARIGSVLEGAFPFAGQRCQRLAESVLGRLNIS